MQISHGPQTDLDPAAQKLRFDGFELDAQQAQLRHHGQPLALTPKSFAVLCALAAKPGQLMTRNMLLDAVWGHRHVSDSALKTILSELRKALADDARKPRYIETVSRRGYRFIAVPEADSLPAPAIRSAAASDTPMFIGREQASRRLHEAWRKAEAGQRQIVWVTGEAGIGKSSLIENFLRESGAVAVGHGQCVEQHGASEPYLPVLEGLAMLCRQDVALIALLRSVAPTWLLQMPWLADTATLDTLRQQLQGSGQERMLREFGELLDRYTGQRPVLLVSEDLHWSDHASLRLLDFMARRRGGARLLWLSSFRVAEVIADNHPLRGLRHELRLHRLAEELLLDPFSEQEVAQYLAARVPQHRASDTLVKRVHARTDGLPLFIASFVDEVLRQGLPDAATPDGPIQEPPVPESLAGVIETQLVRLPELQRQLLDAASVCGTEFSANLLAEVLELELSEVAEHCDELVRRQHWLQAGALERLADGTVTLRYAFRHTLYRQVLYQRCARTTRIRLHGQIASVLLQHRSCIGEVSSAELALHFEQANQLEPALRHYTEAARSAMGRFAPTEAMQLAGHALALLPLGHDSPELLELELGLRGPQMVAATRLLGIGAPAMREIAERLDTLCERLPRYGLPELEVSLCWIDCVSGNFAQAIDRARHKIAVAEQRGDRALLAAACAPYGLTMLARGQLVEARQWFERGLETIACLGTGDADALTVIDLAMALRWFLSQTLVHLGEVDEGLEQLRIAHMRVDLSQQPFSAYRLLEVEGLIQMQLGNLTRVEAIALELREIASQHAIGKIEGAALCLQGWALARRGEPKAGHALILEGYALDEQRGAHLNSSGLLGFAAEALALAGEWPQAQQQLDQAFMRAAHLGERLHLPALLRLQARICESTGDALAASRFRDEAKQEAARQRSLHANDVQST